MNRVSRRTAGCLLAGVFLLGGHRTALAQVSRPRWRIGYLVPYSRLQLVPFRSVFEQAMRDLGYLQGKDYVVEDRLAEGRDDLLPGYANELVRLKVDLILTSSTNGAAAAQRATSSIPIVFEGVSDPVRSGFADSLAHPGHNLTGLSNLSGDLTSKRLELLQKTVPKLHRVAVLVNPNNQNSGGFVRRLPLVADQTGLSLFPVTATSSEELGPAFSLMTQQGVDAVLVMPDGYFWNLGKV
jgi:putative ABC transport system substrate-binding protein